MALIKTTLGEIAILEYGLVDGPFGSNLPARLYTTNGIPVVRGVNLSLGEFRFNDGDYKFVSAETADELKRSNCYPGDIIFTKKGTIGQTGLLPSNSQYKRFLLSSNQMKLTVRRNIALPEFVYYYVSSPDSRRRIIAESTSCGVPKTNVAYLRAFPILLPPIPTQRKIAAILSAYDDLIENNLRRIKILEEMAQNLYREWFVKFRFPGYGQVRFVDTLLGKIPRGWEVKKLGEILELNYGKALKKEDRREGNVPVYGSSGVVGSHDVSLVNGPGIVVGRKGNVGSVYWSEESFFPIDTVYFVTSITPLRFLYYDLQTKNFLNNDAAVPGLNRNQAYSLETVMPPEDIMTRFCQFADDFERQAEALRFQNSKLRRARDLLLPRLISGEVDVSEMDIIVPEEVQNE